MTWKKSNIMIGVVFLLTVCVGLQSSVSAAGEPPVVSPGGPYEASECNAIMFYAFDSYDPEGEALIYRWNFDGTWTEWVSYPFAEYMWLDDYSGFVFLEVSDGDNISSASVEVIVSNIPPVILSIGNPVSLAQATSETLVTVQFFDGDPRDMQVLSLDEFTAVFSWGDGTSTEYSLTSDEHEITGSHQYSTSGEYEVIVTLTDDDGGTTQDSIVVIVDQPTVSIETLLENVYDLNIPDGVKNGLLSKLKSTCDSLEKNQVKPAVNKLEAFINLVEAQRGKKLSFEQADALISAARLLIDSF